VLWLWLRGALVRAQPKHFFGLALEHAVQLHERVRLGLRAAVGAARIFTGRDVRVRVVLLGYRRGDPAVAVVLDEDRAATVEHPAIEMRRGRADRPLGEIDVRQFEMRVRWRRETAFDSGPKRLFPLFLATDPSPRTPFGVRASAPVARAIVRTENAGRCEQIARRLAHDFFPSVAFATGLPSCPSAEASSSVSFSRKSFTSLCVGP
jgi:hypothetical protein